MLFGLLLAVGVGITLGLVGSGGTILTVPILVYVMAVDPVLATSYSLIAVGTTACIGACRGFYKKEVDFAKVLQFALPSLVTVWLTRTYLLPLIPEVIVIGTFHFQQSFILMLLFALVMLGSGISMISGSKLIDDVVFAQRHTRLKTLSTGILLGLVTGVVGAGGGFLIIPVLVGFFGLPMRRAVATSLVIIAINSAFGLLGDLEKLAIFDWNLLARYTLSTAFGIFIGFYLSDKLETQQLKKSFGYFILLVALGIICKELLIPASPYTIH
ncbi:sulfite exporter TauE/SafE family protein [Sphingobacterium oryzagri]|uniref:Probable membrane transporter protein n=1 Tax=Sphingobacterium oryzagri TaxID=3025669 RepID=A0ABY7WBF2_9SPHI|nr:sulfite exporter TauE/SafE family protein [Sphingobacterium sp. KACC 22765]WDF66770.1 sulfite exporter TauE/SafE family protein [Sphingobacterium sp. KACC 22765]